MSYKILRGDFMSVISLRLDDRDDRLVREYAKLNNVSISEFIRKVVVEKIEDEIDVRAFDNALKNMKSTHTMDDVRKELGL